MWKLYNYESSCDKYTKKSSAKFQLDSLSIFEIMKETIR